MKKTDVTRILVTLAFMLTSWSALGQINGQENSAQTLSQILIGDHRTPENIARNASRNPIETLEFFGLKPDMTLIEIGPSGAWYTEILAPYMRDSGRYYGAHFFSQQHE